MGNQAVVRDIGHTVRRKIGEMKVHMQTIVVLVITLMLLQLPFHVLLKFLLNSVVY